MSCSSARVQLAHVMLWPHGKRVTCAGASKQTTHPSLASPASASCSATICSCRPRRVRGGGRPPIAGAAAAVVATAGGLEAGGAPDAPTCLQNFCWWPSWPHARQKKTLQPLFAHWYAPGLLMVPHLQRHSALGFCTGRPLSSPPAAAWLLDAAATGAGAGAVGVTAVVLPSVGPPTGVVVVVVAAAAAADGARLQNFCWWPSCPHPKQK